MVKQKDKPQRTCPTLREKPLCAEGDLCAGYNMLSNNVGNAPRGVPVPYRFTSYVSSTNSTPNASLVCSAVLAKPAFWYSEMAARCTAVVSR